MKTTTILLLLVALTGCASGINGFRQATAAAGATTATAYRALRTFDAHELEGIRERAKTDPHGAEAQLDEYLPKYDLAVEVVDTAADAIVLANDASEKIANGIEVKQDLATWAIELLSLVPRVVKVLADLGITIPGGAP